MEAAALNELPLPVLVALCVVLLACIGFVVVSIWRLRRATPPFLEPTAFKEAVLVKKQAINHNTRLFRFALDHPTQRLGLPVGQHITFKCKMADGSDCFRPYTPVSDDEQLGHVDFVIKVYEQGRMSKYVDDMQVGQALLLKGPKGRFKYEPGLYRAIGMVAGGSGITPMYQVACAVLKGPPPFCRTTPLSLVYANVGEDDILLRKELDDLARMHPNFKVYYVLNNPPASWAGGVGFVSANMLAEHFPPPAPGTVVLRCGPGPMNRVMQGHLDMLSYSADMQFEF